MKIPKKVHLYAVTERITQQHSGPAPGSMQIKVTQGGVVTHSLKKTGKTGVKPHPIPSSSTPLYEPINSSSRCLFAATLSFA